MSDAELEEFKRLGDLASYHYADDSCKEWGLAGAAKNAAMKLYYAATVEQQEQMKVIAKGFLWSLTLEVETIKNRGQKW